MSEAHRSIYNNPYSYTLGSGSHAEGSHSNAIGLGAHAEGYGTYAGGLGSHTEGAYTATYADNSHAEGSGTIASGETQHVQGKFNIEDTENKYAHIVGNGTNNSARSNAHTIDWEGNAWFAGNIMANGILLTDQVTKDIYELVISNGEIKIRNINKLTLALNENEAQVNIDTEALVLSNDIATVSNETLSLNSGEIK